MESAAQSNDWLSAEQALLEKRQNSGADSLRAKRRDAFEKFAQRGFPDSSLEEWKYTNPLPIREKNYPSYLQPISSEKITAYEKFFTPNLDSLKIVTLNGRLLSPPNCPSGVQISSLGEAHRNSKGLASLAEKYLGTIASSEEAFVAINTALLEDAVVVHVAAGTKVQKPIELVQLVDTQGSEKTLLPRVLVIVEKEAELNVIERYVGPEGQKYIVNSVAEFVVDENAKVLHQRLQLESEAAFHVSTLQASVARYGHFATSCFNFGGKLVRNNVNIVMTGSNCEVHMNGLSALNGDQHVDNATLLDNTQPNCFSNELYKGIYDDKSQGVFTGTIIVRQDAQKTNAIQSNRSLLLSDEASINSKPQLKIWADDVKCTHGATVGQLDDDALFYIRSRGVSEEDAKIMLVHAFASELISPLPIPELRDDLENLLLRKLGF